MSRRWSWSTHKASGRHICAGKFNWLKSNVKFQPIDSEIKTLMAYVIAEPCIGTKDAACVDACPVDCIHPKKDEPQFEGADMLYIDPVECIDCGACVPVCPVSAIFALDDLPEKWKEFADKNSKHYGR